MHLFFSSPVWASKIDSYDEINKEILIYLEKLKDLNPKGITKSNLQGWHSENFKLNEDMPKKIISLFKKNINTALDDMNWNLEKQHAKITSMWAIINKMGASNHKHQHGNSDLSAAYYVKAPLDCGDIVFYDPRPAAVFKHPSCKSPNILNATVNSIKPEEGLLVLFPSYLEHSVNANLSNQKRIVISFNLSMENN